LDPGGCEVFPDNGGLVGDFEDSGVRPFCYQCVSVGESLCGAHHRAVEPVVLRGAWEPEAGGVMMVFPDDVQGHGVKFNDAGCQSDVPWHSEVSVACPSAVVEEQDVAFPGEALWDHMGMVQANELTKFLASLGIFGVIRSDFPDNVSGGSTDDGDDVGVSLADDEVLGVEACVGDGV